jgi:DNA-binding MarR family transcriptional regulator
MSHPSRPIPIDRYVFDPLLRDLVGHDKRPAAFLLYVYLYAKSAEQRWTPVSLSLRDLADQTGLSKSALQEALAVLQRRRLVESDRPNRTARPTHRVLRPWRG